MTEQQLIENGFKQKKIDKDSYWYELNIAHHRFITNDKNYHYKKKNDSWHIGYDNKKEWNCSSAETFWFNGKLKDINQFESIFYLLTGKELKVVLMSKLTRNTLVEKRKLKKIFK